MDDMNAFLRQSIADYNSKLGLSQAIQPQGYAMGGQVQPKGIIPGPPSQVDNTLTPTATGEYILPTNAADLTAEELASLVSHIMKYNKPATAKELLDRLSMMSTGQPPNNMGRPAEVGSAPGADAPMGEMGFAVGGERYPDDMAGVKLPMTSKGIQTYPMPPRLTVDKATAITPSGYPAPAAAPVQMSTNAYENGGGKGIRPPVGAPVAATVTNSLGKPLTQQKPRTKVQPVAALTGNPATDPPPDVVAPKGIQPMISEQTDAAGIIPADWQAAQPATNGITEYGADGTNGGFGFTRNEDGTVSQLLTLRQRTAEEDKMRPREFQPMAAAEPKDMSPGSQGAWEREMAIKEILGNGIMSSKDRAAAIAAYDAQNETVRNNEGLRGISQQNADATTKHYGTLDAATTAKLPGELGIQQSTLQNDAAERGYKEAATKKVGVETRLAPGIAQSEAELRKAQGAYAMGDGRQTGLNINALTAEEQDAINKAVVEKRLDPYKINSRNQKMFAGIELAEPGTDLNRIAGDLGVARSKDIILKAGVAKMLPGLLRTVVESGKKLNYSDVQFVGKMQQLAKGQLNDPALVEYKAARNDLLLTIGGVMRGNGMTDMAQKLEEEAASPTMSPKALDGWLKGQMASVDPRLDMYRSLLGGKGIPVERAVETPQPVSAAKQAPDGKWYVPDPARPGKYLQVGA